MLLGEDDETLGGETAEVDRGAMTREQRLADIPVTPECTPAQWGQIRDAFDLLSEQERQEAQRLLIQAREQWSEDDQIQCRQSLEEITSMLRAEVDTSG